MAVLLYLIQIPLLKNNITDSNISDISKDIQLRKEVLLRKIKERISDEIKPQLARAALSLNYVLKNVGDNALSGLPMFSAASLVKTRLSILKYA